jgi:hypothetical protein
MRMAVNVRVEDYETWREGFDGDKENRDKHGIRNTQVYLNADDENDVTVVGKWTTSARLPLPFARRSIVSG